MTCKDLWYWLINHSVFRHETDKKPTAFLFDPYKQKNLKERKTALGCDKKQSQPVNQFPGLSHFTEPEPLNEVVDHVPVRKDPDKKPESFTVSLCPVLPQRSRVPL